MVNANMKQNKNKPIKKENKREQLKEGKPHRMAASWKTTSQVEGKQKKEGRARCDSGPYSASHFSLPASTTTTSSSHSNVGLAAPSSPSRMELERCPYQKVVRLDHSIGSCLNRRWQRLILLYILRKRRPFPILPRWCILGRIGPICLHGWAVDMAPTHDQLVG